MYSLAFMVIALVDFAVLVWAARLCLQYRTNGLIFASLPLTLLWYDNFVIGIGGSLGEGELLKGLNTVRFLAHYIALPMTFIALGAMAREAEFRWARSKLAMGAFCTLATGFIVPAALSAKSFSRSISKICLGPPPPRPPFQPLLRTYSPQVPQMPMLALQGRQVPISW